MGKPRMIGMTNRCIPNSKADMHYRRKAFERNKSKIESEERIYRKAEKDLEEAKRRAMAEIEQNGTGILVHGAMKYGCENVALLGGCFLKKGLRNLERTISRFLLLSGVPFAVGLRMTFPESQSSRAVNIKSCRRESAILQTSMVKIAEFPIRTHSRGYSMGYRKVSWIEQLWYIVKYKLRTAIQNRRNK